MTINAVSWATVTHATEAPMGHPNAHTLCGLDVYAGNLRRKLPIGWWDTVEPPKITCRVCRRKLTQAIPA